jgi:hypothetical protein
MGESEKTIIKIFLDWIKSYIQSDSRNRNMYKLLY